MKRLCSVLVLCSFVGCVGGHPKTMTEIMNVRDETLVHVQTNVNRVVEGYTDKLRSAYEQGLMAVYQSELNKLQDFNGNVSVEAQEALFSQVQVQLKNNEAWLVNEESQVKQFLSRQFAVVRQIDRLDREFHNASGRAPTTFELFNMTTAGAVSLSGQPNTLNASGNTDWTRAVSMVGKAAFEKILREQRQRQKEDRKALEELEE